LEQRSNNLFIFSSNMKQFLIRVLSFGIVFFIIDKLFFVFLFTAPNLESDKRLQFLLEGKINKEIIVMGSSRGAYNIVAGQLEKETGRSAYNISYPGSTIEFHEFLLKTLLKFNKKPKIIVLSIDNPYELLYHKTLNFRLERLYPLAKYNYITAELIQKNDKTALARVLYLARLNRGHFDFKRKKMDVESPILSCGSMPFTNQKKKRNFDFKTKNERYPIEKELKSKRKSFLEFQAVCSKNNIELIYCFAPNFKTYDGTLANRIGQISASKIRCFVYDTTNVKYKNKDYFYDESHLNIKGARLFTNELSTFIKLKVH
jgi:hypothetical protein